MTHKFGSSDAFLDMCETYYRKAVASDLPIFLTSSGDSTPINATPYVARYALFRENANSWPDRERLLSELETVIDAAERQNLLVEAILLGGSFTELDKLQIGDLDCLIFYRLNAQGEDAGLTELSKIQEHAKTRGIDARFVPLDGDVMALIKLTSYFTILYSKSKTGNEIVRCLLLLDCRARS